MPLCMPGQNRTWHTRMKRSQIKRRPLSDTVLSSLEPEDKVYRVSGDNGLRQAPISRTAIACDACLWPTPSKYINNNKRNGDNSQTVPREEFSERKISKPPTYIFTLSLRVLADPIAPTNVHNEVQLISLHAAQSHTTNDVRHRT
jgi:hypothetical protein